MTAYPRLFSEWQIRHQTVQNRIVFAPTCPTWVADPLDGIFTDQAVAYYEERARSGLGMIIIGGTIIHREALYSELNFPGLWDDAQIEGFARVAEAVHRHGTRLVTQLLHPGLRAMNVINKDPAYDLDAEWWHVAPSQVPPGEYPNAPMPKEIEEHEIADVIEAYGTAAQRAVAAGLDGVEFHMAHGYLPWQFLSPLYNHQVVEALACLVLDGGPHPVLVEALLGGDLDEPLAQRRRVVRAGRSPCLGGSPLGAGGAAAVPARLPGGGPLGLGCLRRLVSVEAVAELDAEAPERPLHAVRHRALDGGLMAVCVVLGHGVEPDVRAGRRAGDGDPHRGAVEVR